ncbi:MAG: NERD domain-containing protein, partial [Atribacterota bacterium]
SEYLEDKSFEYLRKILPGSEIYKNIYYREDNQEYETDGIIIYDSNIIIIEAKSGKFSLSAKRGGLKRMKKNIKELIDDSFSQALRTKKYIKESQEPLFKYEDNTIALDLKEKNKYKNIYLFNTTLCNLGHIATHLNSIKRLGLIEGEEWPWSVFINDLRVISELIEFPTEFFTFIDRRLKVNDYPQFHAFDELDYLMIYFYEGLYFESDRMGKYCKITPAAYTEDLDRYYDYSAGRVPSGKKPKIKISERYKKLILKIEKTKKYGFTELTRKFLGFDSETRKKFLEYIDLKLGNSRKSGKDKDFSMIFNKVGFGLTCCVNAVGRITSKQKIKKYCTYKMTQTQLNKWYLLLIESADGSERYDFMIFKEKRNFI